MEKMQVCPKGCHVTDRGRNICPQCGGFMKEYSKNDFASIQSDIREMQRESAKSYNNGIDVNARLI